MVLLCCCQAPSALQLPLKQRFTQLSYFCSALQGLRLRGKTQISVRADRSQGQSAERFCLLVVGLLLLLLLPRVVFGVAGPNPKSGDSGATTADHNDLIFFVPSCMIPLMDHRSCCVWPTRIHGMLCCVCPTTTLAQSSFLLLAASLLLRVILFGGRWCGRQQVLRDGPPLLEALRYLRHHLPPLLHSLHLLLRAQHLLLYVVCFRAAPEPAACSMQRRLQMRSCSGSNVVPVCVCPDCSSHPSAAALLPPSSGASCPLAKRTHTVPFLLSGSSCLQQSTTSSQPVCWPTAGPLSLLSVWHQLT